MDVCEKDKGLLEVFISHHVVTFVASGLSKSVEVNVSNIFRHTLHVNKATRAAYTKSIVLQTGRPSCSASKLFRLY